MNKHDEAIDWVLDYMVKHGRITGQARPDHAHKWVSALVRLTEERHGVRILSVKFGSEHHANYHALAAAVVYLESIGFIVVERASGGKSAVGNNVEVITLANL